MRGTLLLLFLLCSPCTLNACSGNDVLKAGQNITGTTCFLASASKKFVLGFFSPQGRPNDSYLGIWYNQSQFPGSQTLVWVANRDQPVTVGVFQITQDGNLVVTDSSGVSYWSTELGNFSSTNMTVQLMDSGNLVLLQYDQTGKTTTMYQSFDDPTDTFLLGMNMDLGLKLTSWSSDNDPRSGSYTFMLASDGDNPYVIFKHNQLYWERGIKNLSPRSMFGTVVFLLNNLKDEDPYSSSATNTSRYKNIGNRFGKIHSPPRFIPRVPVDEYNKTRLVMNFNGELQFLTWDGIQQDWILRWKAPDSPCDKYNHCGNFASCDYNLTQECKCLPGFSSLVGVKGCTRKSSSSCSGGTTTFLNLVTVKARIPPDEPHNATSESECKQICLNKCPQCQAYSYHAEAATSNRDGDDDSAQKSCGIWTEELVTLQEGFHGDDSDNDEDNGGLSFFVRVDISDIEPTPRTCAPCGTNMVPYPLSTSLNCGDPLYFNFSCNPSTGQLSFISGTSNSNATYQKVAKVYPESRKFVMQVDPSNTHCEDERPENNETMQIHTPPFSVTYDCFDKDKVEVTWEPPDEPVCSEPKDCVGWNHSSCKVASGGKRCLCDKNYHWDGILLKCTIADEGKSESQISLILGITLGSVIILACAITLAYLWRRKITRKIGKESNVKQRKRFIDSVRHVKDLIEEGGLEEQDNEGIEVPYFDFESIVVATDNFSEANKLGRGDYGPVYKGKLQSGEIVAVKRLSNVSSQGLQEFKNEVVLIAKLQHRNLVRLRGYCIKGDEKILLYEYMHNKSLDSFIFDPTQSILLDWEMRFNIIRGIARGLLYLHQDSRLRVIHRDLKTSNILLDEEMQPKISDFGLAKIVAGKESEANTERVVGTYGYMSPEYAFEGLFSTKSDIFSFGVVLLEILSGKKNTGFYQSQEFTSLLTYAWRLWTENRVIDLMDMCLSESCMANQFIKCAHIGLLCVQDDPGDRPTMSTVLTLLDGEIASISSPKQPTFSGSRGQSSTTTSTRPEISLHFESNTEESR